MIEMIIKEAARSIVEAELSKITKLQTESIPQVLKNVCNDLTRYLKDGLSTISDRHDLQQLRTDLLVISALVDLFSASSRERSSLWPKPIIHACYESIGIKLSPKRTILIIHSSEISEYTVSPDLLSHLPRRFFIANGDKVDSIPHPIIDIFHIPIEAKFDLASIALIAHECAHVLLQQSLQEILDSLDLEQVVNENAEDQDDLFKVEPRQQLRERLASHIEEYICDEIGRHILGPAFDFALIKFLIPFAGKTASHTHPGEANRIEKSLTNLKKCENNDPDIRTCLSTMTSVWDELFDDLKRGAETLRPEDTKAQELAGRWLKTSKFSPLRWSRSDLEDAWKKVTPELNAFRPPFETVSDASPSPITPIESVLVAVIYYYGGFYKKHNHYYLESKTKQEDKDAILRRKLIEHIEYAISLFEFVERCQKNPCNDFYSKESKTTLWGMRNRKIQGEDAPFVVTPSIDPQNQYGTNSVDLRLGPSFLVHRPPRYTHITPRPRDRENTDDIPISVFYDEVQFEVDEDFILHPHQFVLASSLEYVSLPSDFFALVLGRSTWGRLGLNIATATTVQAGYRGCLTLELRNLGETPLPLTIGTRIAQLCLLKVPRDNTSEGYFASGGKYVGPVKPEIPKIRDDEDWKLLAGIESVT